MIEFPWRQADGSPLPITAYSGPINWPPDRPDQSIWRFRQVIPVGHDAPVSLGEGSTPLIDGPEGFSIKCEYVSPSGSFKDRGSSVLMTGLRNAGVVSVFLDS